MTFTVEKTERGLIKLWAEHVPVEEHAMAQLRNVANMPFIWKWVAAMPDVHVGQGATIGSVIPCKGAVMPSAVGVDIGCGMKAVQTNLFRKDVPKAKWGKLRTAIEASVPHGRSDNGGARDVGSWRGKVPCVMQEVWEEELEEEYKELIVLHPQLGRANHVGHLGTLGSGNHFIEVCVDTDDRIWIMLHSGSRGIGNRIGSHFTQLAKELMKQFFVDIPDMNLAYIPQKTELFGHYLKGANWAQKFAARNRDLMYDATIGAMECVLNMDVQQDGLEVNCHHNYVSHEKHYGANVLLCRKGAVSARKGEYGIIPGSMGTKSYIVKGLGNRESFWSCSHGAGRLMSRTDARNKFTVAMHRRATEGIECRKDKDVLDETPGSYKDIDAVMASQTDLVEEVTVLKQIIVVKG